MHACDISHPTRKYEVSAKWTTLLMEEFFEQGESERERGIKVSFLCDREKDGPRVGANQVFFINHYTLPVFE